MIIPKSSKLTKDQIDQLEGIASDFDCSILEIQGRNRCVYAILGDEGRGYVQEDCRPIIHQNSRND